MSRPYYRAEERKKQIVSVALDLVSKHGVRGATLNRIARGVGITTPALYGHFAGRRDILLEVMDDVFENVRELHRAAKNPNALERLREIGIGHTRLVSDKEGFALAFFEFIAAPPDEDLREPLGRKELTLVEDLVEIVKEGQSQGTIRQDIDPCQIAWMIVSRAWTEDIAYLMGIEDHWSPVRSRWMLEHILELIAAPQTSSIQRPNEVAPDLVCSE
jgi:AcrR family transcriptional regulator